MERIENPMLDPNGYDYFKREVDDGAKVCPICEGSKFKDNDICYSCRTLIREEFVVNVWNKMSKRTQNAMTIYKLKELPLYQGFLVSWARSERELVSDEVENLLDIL